MSNNIEYCIKVTSPYHPMQWFSYTKVKYNPLSHEEVYKCSEDFTKQIPETLNSLHANDFAYCDLRTDNICVNNDFHLHLIDMDQVEVKTNKRTR